MCELLEKAREVQGGISYYEVAKRLNIPTALMNRWKNNKSQPNGINTLRLAEMAKLMPSEAIKLVEKGFIDLSLLIMTGMAGIALAYWDLIASSLYIMFNRFNRVLKSHQQKRFICA